MPVRYNSVRQCSAQPPDSKLKQTQHKLTLNRSFRLLNGTREPIDNPSQILYLQTRYICLYPDSTPVPVSSERIRIAHAVLYGVYMGTNANDVAKLPNTIMYPWASRRGVPNISLGTSPIIEFHEVKNTGWDTGNILEQVTSHVSPTDGILNIYVVDVPTEHKWLGVAWLGSNIAAVHVGSLGDLSSPGALGQRYGQGKTLVHEVGHCFSLPHTFSDDTCDAVSVFPDVPEQINPNFETKLFLTENGWTCSHDHRYNERITPQADQKSCLSVALDSDLNAPNEMGVNFMDYGTDMVSILFTQSQVAMMREYIYNAPPRVFMASTVPLVVPSQNSDTSQEGGITSQPQKDNTLIIVLIIVLVVIVTVVLLSRRVKSNIFM